MGTDIRPEISEKNTYYISRHRYYELKHFCLQYPEWKRLRASIDGCASVSGSISKLTNDGTEANPTAVYAEARLYFSERMEMVEHSAQEAAGDLSTLLLRAVTEELSYDKIAPPCCKEIWYAAYRRFFWLLDKARK